MKEFISAKDEEKKAAFKRLEEEADKLTGSTARSPRKPYNFFIDILIVYEIKSHNRCSISVDTGRSM